MGEHPQWAITWHDAGREPQEPPDPRYPAGVDLEPVEGEGPRCHTPLPYPARRCGFFLVRCLLCGLRVAVTTAGRPDDPRTLTVSCKPVGEGP